MDVRHSAETAIRRRLLNELHAKINFFFFLCDVISSFIVPTSIYVKYPINLEQGTLLDYLLANVESGRYLCYAPGQSSCWIVKSVGDTGAVSWAVCGSSCSCSCFHMGDHDASWCT
jgi:hypothetical protein